MSVVEIKLSDKICVRVDGCLINVGMQFVSFEILNYILVS